MKLKKINRISAMNLKGQNLDYELTGFDLIVGNNFSGKSAIVDAIKIALMGYVPEVGKQNVKTFLFSSGKNMMVSATTNEGVISRSFEIKNRSVSQSSTDNCSEIPDTIGVILNPYEFFGLTKSNQINYIFDLIVGDKKVSEDVRSIIKNFSEDFAEEFLEEIMESLEEVGDSPEFLEKALLATAEMLKTKKRVVKESKGGVAQLDAIRTYEELVKANGSTEEIGEQIKKARESRSKAEAEMNKQISFRKSHENYKAKEKHIESLQAMLKGRVIVDIPAMKAEQQEVVDLINKEEAKINKLQLLKDEESQSVDEEIEQLNITFERETDPVHKSLGSEIDKKNRLNQEIHDLDRKTNYLETEIQKAVEDIENINNKKECPYCKSDSEDWRDRVVLTVKGLIKSKEKELDQIKKAYETRSKDLEGVIETMSSLQKILDDKSNDLEKSVDARKNDFNKSKKEIQEQIGLHEEKRSKLKDRMDKIFSEIEKGSKQESIKSEINLCQKQLDETDLPVLDEDFDRDDSLNEIQRISDREDELIAITQEISKAKKHVEIQEQMLQNIETEKKKIDCLNLILTGIKNLKTDLVESAISKVLIPANKIIKGILKFELDYQNDEFGYRSGSTWVTYKTFSGAERIVAFAALALGIASISPFRLIVMDEMGVIEKGLRVELLKKIGKMYSDGELDQFIGICPSDGDYSDEGISGLSITEVGY